MHLRTPSLLLASAVLLASRPVSRPTAGGAELSVAYVMLEAEDVEALPGERVSLDYGVTNAGACEAEDVSVGFYLSTDLVLGPDDTLLEREEVSVEASETEDEFEQVTLPSNVASGCYRLLVVVDDLDRFAEADEDDNVGSAAIAIDESIVACNARLPDLVVSAASREPDFVLPGGSLAASMTIRNVGSAAASDVEGFYFLSEDATYDGYFAETLLAFGETTILPAGASVTFTDTLTIPAGTAPGAYTLFFVADAGEDVAELDEDNNLRRSPLEIVDASRAVRFRGTVEDDGSGGYEVRGTTTELLGSVLDYGSLVDVTADLDGYWNGSSTSPGVFGSSARTVAPSLTLRGSPTLGRSFDLVVSGEPGGTAFALVANAAAFLPLFGGSDVLFLDASVLQESFTATIPASGSVRIAVLVPNEPALAGRGFPAQAATTRSAGSPTLTNPIRLTIGSPAAADEGARQRLRPPAPRASERGVLGRER